MQGCERLMLKECKHFWRYPLHSALEGFLPRQPERKGNLSDKGHHMKPITEVQ